MKLTLTLDEVSACAMALLSKAQEAEEEALGCEKLRCASAAEFWEKRAKPASGHPYGPYGLRAGRL